MSEIPLLGGERPKPGGPIVGPDQLAYVLSEMLDDASPLRIMKWKRLADSLWPRLVTATEEARAALERLGDQAVSTAGMVVMDAGDTDESREGRRRALEDFQLVRDALGGVWDE